MKKLSLRVSCRSADPKKGGGPKTCAARVQRTCATCHVNFHTNLEKFRLATSHHLGQPALDLWKAWCALSSRATTGFVELEALTAQMRPPTGSTNLGRLGCTLFPVGRVLPELSMDQFEKYTPQRYSRGRVQESSPQTRESSNPLDYCPGATLGSLAGSVIPADTRNL